MPSPEDIYSKEEPPAPARVDHRSRTEIPNSPAPPPAPQGNFSTGPVRPAGDKIRSSHRLRRRRRRGEPAPEERFFTLNKVLWLSLSSVVAVYLVLLGIARPRTRSVPVESSPPPARASLKPATATPAAEEEQRAESEVVAGKIQQWDAALFAAQDAYALLDRRNIHKAESRLVAAIESSPAMIDLQQAMTRVYVAQKLYGPAKENLLKILDADPARVSARLSLATILAAEKNHAATLAVGKWVLQADPYSVAALQLVANAHIALDEYSLALPHLRKIVSLEPDNIVAENNLGVVYTRVGQFNKAEDLFQQLLEKKPDNSITHYNLAVCFVLQGQTIRAVELLNKAAAEFGSSFVYTWLQGPDFDPIREDAGFAELFGRLASAVLAPDDPAAPATATRLTQAEESRAAGERPNDAP